MFRKIMKVLAVALMIAAVVAALSAAYMMLAQKVNFGIRLRKSKNHAGKSKNMELIFHVKNNFTGSPKIIRFPGRAKIVPKAAENRPADS